jgi:uncharacterized protein YecE (DUF72 family)
MRIYIGCSGWSYKHWIGKFYPSDFERKDWLNFYTNYFKTVEVNMTFYRFPFPNMLKSWYNKTPEDFKFTFKANRLITHEKKFKDTSDLITKFLNLLDLLKNKIGCILWQLPPSMHFSDENVETLDKFLAEIEERKNVIEFRHKSWWNEETYRLLKKHKAIFCILSSPTLPEDFVVTSDIAYIRFHGLEEWYRYNYSKEEMEEWADKIKETKCKEIYCYFNNDFEAHAPKNALQLMKILDVKMQSLPASQFQFS